MVTVEARVLWAVALAVLLGLLALGGAWWWRASVRGFGPVPAGAVLVSAPLHAGARRA